ncbi:gcy-21 [Symbiodinium natans]|uniref:Gcy-21 protein n=1 Tax=Symbiodinium natans TaxID=878477 RepID=A0A812Q7S3_9DINO|nr:gcy-21 [Symbiodinium natans]
MRSGRVVVQSGHFVFVVLVMLSYMLLPRYANNGSDAVPDNVVALLFFPVYSAFMISYQLQSTVAVAYFAGFSLVVLIVFISPQSAENGYPSEGVAFMGYSLIFVMKGFIGERSLRSQFKARQAIDICKTRIEGILDSMMPKLVINELQRASPDDALPSHHYFRATVVQSDLAGFTRLAGLKSPEEVVRTISHLFGLFDEEADRLGIYKVETVGDAYIAGQAEPPLTEENRPPSVIDFGLSMVKATQEWAKETGEDIQCRVTWPTVQQLAWHFFRRQQRYHLFGLLIHQLELLEATAPPNRVQAGHWALELLHMVGAVSDFRISGLAGWLGS